ncbi:MAG: hypothetical protein LBJ60_00620, partial [Tannerellaceae bacterium]|nr:hypothetical protein [Tannerellaceae bacterium]
MNVDKNESEQALTEGKGVINFNQESGLNTDSLSNDLDYYLKIIEKCTISESTKRFLACIIMLS